MRRVLEVAEIFRHYGPAYRQAHADRLGSSERRVMAAIEACLTPALGGHAEHCADCGFVRQAYNSCPPVFFLPVRVLSRRFHDVFVRRLRTAFAGGDLRFPGALAALADPAAFAAQLAAVACIYAKPPFAGPVQVLGYLGRYAHRVAIANSRLVGLADGQVSSTPPSQGAGSGRTIARTARPRR